jgi:NADH-quinone oxidoreductase subunit E
MLQGIQAREGYLSEQALRALSRHTGWSLVDIYGVATFYRSFSLKPRGKHLLCACLGTACHLAGGQLVLDAVARELKVEVGGTTEDREFDLDRVACIGCCALAPVITIGQEIYPRMTPVKVEEVLVALNPRSPL